MEFNPINPRHLLMLAKHTIGKNQFNIGRKYSPLELMDTTEVKYVFYHGLVYKLSPTHYVPVINGRVTLKRPWVYDRDRSGKYLGESRSGHIICVATIDELYVAVPRESLPKFNSGETSHRIYELLSKYVPEATCEFGANEDGHIRSVIVELGDSKYIVNVSMSHNITVTDYNTGLRAFRSLVPEGILSWFKVMTLSPVPVVPVLPIATQWMTTERLYNLVQDCAYNLCITYTPPDCDYDLVTINDINEELITRMHRTEEMLCNQRLN